MKNVSTRPPPYVNFWVGQQDSAAGMAKKADSMKVTVKLIGPLIYEAGFSEKALRLPAKTTAGQLIARVKIEKSRPIITTRNGRAVAPEDELKEGDRVVISHIYSGG